MCMLLPVTFAYQSVSGVQVSLDEGFGGCLSRSHLGCRGESLCSTHAPACPGCAGSGSLQALCHTQLSPRSLCNPMISAITRSHSRTLMGSCICHAARAVLPAESSGENEHVCRCCISLWPGTPVLQCVSTRSFAEDASAPGAELLPDSASAQASSIADAPCWPIACQQAVAEHCRRTCDNWVRVLPHHV